MDSTEIRRRFLEFFSARGGPASGGEHKIVPSSSLLPDDPSVLLTTAGMQQFKPYFIGRGDPLHDFGSKNTVSVQKCFRTSDIDEVGDESHLTFFEMLGHFSFGDYFKKETIEWTYELLTKVFKIEPERISVTVFAGDEKIPFDKESYETWSKFLPPERIRQGPRADNVWGPAGPEGPCGAANEVYVDGLEVATLVFMEYFCAKDQNLIPLPQEGVDVGWGLERVAMIIQGKKNIFETDLFKKIIEVLPEEMPLRKKRILADHTRAISFLIADGVRPGNKGAGYVLRRLLRRLLAQTKMEDLKLTIDLVINKYSKVHKPELDGTVVMEEINNEWRQFIVALDLGMKALNKSTHISPESAFNLYESYGLPFEVIKDKFPKLRREDFEREFQKHQGISRVGAEKKFAGGLVDHEPETVKLHTAHHLLLASLQRVLGPHIKQRGSNITAERLRLDFSHPAKLTDEEKKRVEGLVNKKIKENLAVVRREMSREEAEKIGAEMEFGQKYGERVSVYFIEDEKGNIFSKEFCAGPHVERTGELAPPRPAVAGRGPLRIIKEEAVAAGTRRIRAVLE